MQALGGYGAFCTHSLPDDYMFSNFVILVDQVSSSADTRANLYCKILTEPIVLSYPCNLLNE